MYRIFQWFFSWFNYYQNNLDECFELKQSNERVDNNVTISDNLEKRDTFFDVYKK